MLRAFSEESPISRCFASKCCPLIQIEKKEIHYGQSEKEKIGMLKNRKKGDRFVIPRAGERRTDVFEVSETDIQNILTGQI